MVLIWQSVDLEMHALPLFAADLIWVWPSVQGGIPSGGINSTCPVNVVQAGGTLSSHHLISVHSEREALSVHMVVFASNLAVDSFRN